MGPMAAHLPLRGSHDGPLPRVAVVGRHLAVTQALLARQVRLLPRGPVGPTHKWRCTSPARRTKTVRVRLGPPCRPSRRPSRAGAASCGRGGIGRRTGLRSRRTWSMRVRPSPSVPRRETGRRRRPPPVGADPPPRPDPAAGASPPPLARAGRSPASLRPAVTGNRAGSYPADRSSNLRGRTIREWCNRQHTWL